MRVDEQATKVARGRHALGLRVLHAHFGVSDPGPYAFTGTRPAPMSRAGLLAYRRYRDGTPSGYRRDRGFRGAPPAAEGRPGGEKGEPVSDTAGAHGSSSWRARELERLRAGR